MLKNIQLTKSAEQENGRKSFSYVGLGFFGYTMLSMVVLPLVISASLIHFFPSLADHFFMSLPITYIYLYVVSLPLMLLFLKRLPDRTATVLEKKIPITRVLGFYFMTVFFMLVINTSALTLDALLGVTTTASTETIAQLGIPQWLVFIFGVIIAPVMEEIVFRWLPYKKLSGYGEKNYVIWTSIIFGLFHMNFGQSLYTAVAGIFLAVLTYRTGTIKYSLIMHMLMNFFGGVGIGGFFVAAGEEMMLMYALFNIFCALIGIVCFIIFLVRYRKTFWSQKDKFDWSSLLNVGTIVYMIFPLFVIISYFFV